MIYRRFFKSWNFSKAGSGNLNQALPAAKERLSLIGAMQPDSKARVPAKIKTNFWNMFGIKMNWLTGVMLAGLSIGGTDSKLPVPGAQL